MFKAMPDALTLPRGVLEEDAQPAKAQIFAGKLQA
jgi:hypothetical protein